MVEIVILVGLNVIFPAAVRRRRRYQEVNPVPQEGEGRGKEEKGWAHTAVVIEMLHRVHGEAGEGLDVSVAVVETVDVFVEGRDVHKPVIIAVYHLIFYTAAATFPQSVSTKIT